MAILNNLLNDFLKCFSSWKQHRIHVWLQKETTAVWNVTHYRTPCEYSQH
jgi:hypothetical protein